MSELVEHQTGEWWRFDHYEIRDGYIRPAPGAQLSQYSPWDSYRVSRGGVPPRPPYDSLLALLEGDLLKEFRLSPGTPEQPYSLTRAGEAAVSAWCAEHGLLGILPHLALFARISPIWAHGAAAQSPDDPKYPTSWLLTRTSTGWNPSAAWTAPIAWLRGEPQPVDLSAFALADPTLRPRVVLGDLEGTTWKEESLGQTWAQFFPDVPEAERETFDYPVPLSTEFWTQYAEPVDSFVTAAFLLRDALDGLHRFQQHKLLFVPNADAWHIRRGVRLLEALTAGISPSIDLDWGGRIRPRWVSPSLLASLSMMLYMDLTQGQRRPRRCEVCNRLFVSDAHAATYCSDKCRRTAQKRAYRARQRLKDEEANLANQAPKEDTDA